MSSLLDLLAAKESRLYTISPDATVLDAIAQMNRYQVGALIVMRQNQIAGIFTERDVLRRVAAQLVNPAQTTVEEVMTKDVHCCGPDVDVEEASQIMKHRRIRHLPVCDAEGRLCGMISIGDLNAFYCSAQEQTISSLTDYIYGRT